MIMNDKITISTAQQFQGRALGEQMNTMVTPQADERGGLIEAEA